MTYLHKFLRMIPAIILTCVLCAAGQIGVAQTVGAPLDASLILNPDAPSYPDGNPPAELIAAMNPGPSSSGAVSLKELKNPDSDFYRRRGTFRVSSARAQVIQAAAQGVGIRGGFAVEADRINTLLMGKYRSRVERTYPFRPLMLQNGYVVPPVITSISKVRELSGPNYLYLTNGSFEVTREPRLTTLTPTWMDWLLLPIRGVRPPEAIQLKGADEKYLWASTVEQAWDKGVREARLSFNTALATLHRDYNGMRLYHQLAASGALSIPQIDVKRVAWRVTADGKRAFSDEVSIEIVVGPKFRRR